MSASEWGWPGLCSLPKRCDATKEIEWCTLLVAILIGGYCEEH